VGDLHRLIDVGVLENNVGGLASEFQRHSLQGVCRLALNQLADLCGACERYLINVWVVDDGSAGGRSEPRHDVDDPGGEPRLLRQLTNVQA